MSHTTRFTRLIITVPSPIAEAFGSALIEVGAGAVEQREPPDVELVVTLPEGSAVEQWEALVRELYRAFAEQLELPQQGLRVSVEGCELDYHAAWLARLVPQRLTERLVFVPTHCRDQAGAEGGLLYFEPHPCFGDGSHPTTRLAARAVEQACERAPGLSMLDVGTGNGVLCFVAAVAGAKRAYGIDLDPEAVACAEQNAELNRLESRCRFAETALDEIEERFPLVVANLEPRTQQELLETIATRVERGGTLILTGFLVEQAQRITQPLPPLGFHLEHSEAAGGYALQVWRAGEGGHG